MIQNCRWLFYDKLAVHNCLPYSSAKYEDELLLFFFFLKNISIVFLFFSSFPEKKILLYNKEWEVIREMKVRTKRFFGGWWERIVKEKGLTCFVCTCCFSSTRTHYVTVGHGSALGQELKTTKSSFKLKILNIL